MNNWSNCLSNQEKQQIHGKYFFAENDIISREFVLKRPIAILKTKRQKDKKTKRQKDKKTKRQKRQTVDSHVLKLMIAIIQKILCR